MVEDVVTLRRASSRPFFPPYMCQPGVRVSLTSVNLLVCCLYYYPPLHPRTVPRFFLILSRFAYIRKHSPQGRWNVSLTTIPVSPSPFSLWYLPHAETVISVEKCDARIFSWNYTSEAALCHGLALWAVLIFSIVCSAPCPGGLAIMWVRNNRHEVYM